MDRRPPRGVAEEWREQGVSGQPLCRLAMGAASRGAVGWKPSGENIRHQNLFKLVDAIFE